MSSKVKGKRGAGGSSGVRFEMEPENNLSLPTYKWRIPTFLAGVVNSIDASIYIYLCLSWLYHEYQSDPGVKYIKINDVDDPIPITGDRTWLVLGIMLSAIYIPFNLFAIFYSIGLIQATVKPPRGGIDKNYDACDEAEDKLDDVLSWRSYSIAALSVTFVVFIISLIFSLFWIKALIHLAILYGLLQIVKQHIKEVNEFIEIQEKRALLKIRRKSRAMVDMLRMAD